MGMGIEVYDDAGNLIFDVGNRLFKILTTTTAGSGGTYANALVGATIVGVNVQQTDASKTPPTASVSGNTVTWGFSGGGVNDTGATLQILAY